MQGKHRHCPDVSNRPSAVVGFQLARSSFAIAALGYLAKQVAKAWSQELHVLGNRRGISGKVHDDDSTAAHDENVHKQQERAQMWIGRECDSVRIACALRSYANTRHTRAAAATNPTRTHPQIPMTPRDTLANLHSCLLYTSPSPRDRG